MNKIKLLQNIISALSQSLEVLDTAARASHFEATHESSKAESKYDTRGLEAAYLAGGQARQAREIMEAMKVYSNLTPKTFPPESPIDLTALVELEMDRTRSLFFVGPRSGGLEVMMGEKEITVITPESPIGKALMGRKAGDKWVATFGKSNVRYRIISVV